MKRDVVIELRLEDKEALAAIGRLKIEQKQWSDELRRSRAEAAKNNDTTAETSERLGELASRIKNADAVLREMTNKTSGLTDANMRFRDKMAQASIEALKQSGILGQLDARSTTLTAQIDALGKEYAEGKVTAEQFAQQNDRLQKELGETTAAMTKMDAKLEELNKDFKEGRITAEQFKAGVNSVNQQVAQASGAFTKGVTDLKNYALGFVGVVAGVQALMSVLNNIGQTIVNFDKAQSNLAAILNTNKQGIAELTEEAKRYGSTTQFTAAQVSELQTELAKLGFTQTQIKQATPAVLDLAAATGTSLGNAATIAAQTLNAFGLEASETGRIVDVIAQSANLSAFDIDTFSAAMSNVAPAAKSVGVSLEETTALLSALVDSGIVAEKAGTDLRTIFISLAEKGLTLEEAYGKIKGSTDSLTTAVELFDQRAAGSALILADNTEKVGRLKEGYEQAAGAAKQMAETQLDNIQGSGLLLQSAWEGFVLSVEDGSGIIGKAWTGLNNMLADILENLTALSDKQLDDFTAAVEKSAQAVGDMNDIRLDSTAAQEIIEQYQRQVDALKDYGNTASEIAIQEDELGKLRARLAQLSGKDLTSRGKIEREAVRVAIERYEANLKEARSENDKAAAKKEAAETLAKATEEERKAAEKAAKEQQNAAAATANRAASVRVLTDRLREFQQLQKQLESGQGIGPMAVRSPTTGEQPEKKPLGPSPAVQAAVVEGQALAQAYSDDVDAYTEAQLAKIAVADEFADALGGLTQLLGEQTAAGKTFATAQALINTYLGVTQILANKTTLPEPAGTIQKTLAVAGTLATGLAAVRRIQGFAEGGVVQQADGPRYTANRGDSVLISAAPGEVVLTRDQQLRLKALAGHRIFNDIGVPGFASGGLVRGTALVNMPRTPSSGAVANAELSRAINSIDMSPVVRVTEIMDVMRSVQVAQSAASL
jgi:hypothetical protein